MIDLTDSHEVLISEYEMLEREFDQFRVAKERELKRLRDLVKELRGQLRSAVEEVHELQDLLSRSYLKA